MCNLVSKTAALPINFIRYEIAIANILLIFNKPVTHLIDKLQSINKRLGLGKKYYLANII